MISTLLRLASLDAGGRVGVATRATVLVLDTGWPRTIEEGRELIIILPVYTIDVANKERTKMKQNANHTMPPSTCFTAQRCLWRGVTEEQVYSCENSRLGRR